MSRTRLQRLTRQLQLHLARTRTLSWKNITQSAKSTIWITRQDIYAPYGDSRIVKIADDRENEVFIYYPVKDGVELEPIIMWSGNFVKWLDESNDKRGLIEWDDIETTDKL